VDSLFFFQIPLFTLPIWTKILSNATPIAFISWRLPSLARRFSLSPFHFLQCLIFFFFSPAQLYSLIHRFVCCFLSSSIVGNLVLFHPFRLCSVFVFPSASIIQCLVFWSLCHFTFGNC